MPNSGQQQTRLGRDIVRTTGSTARKVLAGLFLGVVMTLSLAGIAAAQTGSGSGSGTGGSTTTTNTTATTIHAAARTTARTGMNTAVLLLVGGGLTVAVLGVRRLARASTIN